MDRLTSFFSLNTAAKVLKCSSISGRITCTTRQRPQTRMNTYMQNKTKQIMPPHAQRLDNHDSVAE